MARRVTGLVMDLGGVLEVARLTYRIVCRLTFSPGDGTAVHSGGTNFKIAILTLMGGSHI